MITNMFNILDKKFDLQKEIKKIIKLFFNSQIPVPRNNSDFYTYLSIEEIIDSYGILRYWKQRRTYLKCDEIRMDLKLSNDELQKKTIQKNKILMLTEYMLNMILLMSTRYNNELAFLYDNDQQIRLIIDNIRILLEHLNYQYIIEDEKILVIQKDISIKLAVEKTKQERKNIFKLIYEYEHHSLKGNIGKKKDILMNIYRTFENIFDSKNNEGFKEYIRTLNKCYNGLDIRHNNESELSKVQRDRQEEIYDKLYKFTLFCLLIKDNKKIKKELDDFYKELL